MSAHPVFSHENSFIGVSISLVHQPPFTVYNFYSPGRPTAFANLIKNHDFVPESPSIIMGDLNAHHIWWAGPKYSLGAVKYRERDEAIVSWLNEHSYQLHNEPGVLTHFPHNGNTPSVIDLTFSRGEISKRILSWSADPVTTSDHALCTIVLNISPSKASPPGRCWKKADWPKFAKLIRTSTTSLKPAEVTSDTELLSLTTKFISTITESIDECVPARKMRRKNAPWWNHNLTVLKSKLLCSERRYRQHRNEENKQSAHHHRTQWTKSIETAKRNYWDKQLADSTATTIWKTLRNHNTHQQPLPPLDGETSFDGKCTVLRHSLFPSTSDPPDIPATFVESKADLSQQFDHVTVREVDHVIEQLRYGTAAGEDGINYITVQQVHAANPLILPQLFTELFRRGVHPAEWKVATCVVVPKAGKPNYKTAKSYRPISLQSCLGKVQETLTAHRIARAAAACGATSPSQLGGRQNNSAIDAIVHLLDNIAPNLSIPKKNTKIVDRISVLTHDIEGAFNNTHPKLLVQVMEQRGMPKYLINWTKAFTSDRTMSFSFDGKCEPQQPFISALPQGSPASPILFLIYAQAMLERGCDPLKELDLSYLDDIVMTKSGPSVESTVKNLESRTNDHINRAAILQLELSSTKSDLMHTLPKGSVQKKNLCQQTPLIYTDQNGNQVIIEPNDEMKYLGVLIDNSLTFQQHSLAAASLGHQSLARVRFLRKKSWGISSHIAHHIIFTAVLPKMLWASPAWWNGTPQVLDPLSVVYHTAARWVTGLHYTSRITKLLTAACLPPLHLFLDYLSQLYAVRTCFLPEGHILTSTPVPQVPSAKRAVSGRHYLQSLISNFVFHPLENRSSSTTGYISSLIKPIHNTKSDVEKSIHNFWITSLELNSLVIYTDGSKHANGDTGSGWIVYEMTLSGLQPLVDGYCNIGTRAEVFDSELHAVEESLEFLTRQHFVQPRIKIYILIDNQSAIQTLENNKLNSQYARNAINHSITLVNRGYSVQTAWVPSHIGIAGNEKADQLANLGSKHLTECKHTCTTKAWMNKVVRAQFFSKWQKELPFSTPSFKYPTHLQSLRWKTSRALAAVQCGRTPSDPRYGFDSSPLCVCGNGPQSSIHILQDCSLVDQARAVFLTKCSGTPSDPEFLFNKLNIPHIIKFCSSTGLGFSENIRSAVTRMSPVCSPIESEMEDNDEDNADDFGAFEVGLPTVDDD
jgi:ribonuclease HI